MKATIDFDESLYRRLKVEAARRGTTIRELVDQGVRQVIDAPAHPHAAAPAGEWVGMLQKYAANAKGRHDMASVRASIAKGRRGKAR